MVQEVQGVRVGVGEELREWSLGHEWQVAHVFLGSWRANTREGLLVRCTKDVEDLVELIDIISTLEERTSAKQLGKNTSYGPDIN